MPRIGPVETQQISSATGHKDDDLSQLYNEYFTAPQDDDPHTHFKLVSMFSETEQVVMTDSTDEAEDAGLAELE